MTADIVERLKAPQVLRLPGNETLSLGPDAIHLEAAAEIGRLREALKPFADRCAEAVRPDDSDNDGVTVKTKYLASTDEVTPLPGEGV